MALQSNEAAKAALEAMMNVEQWRDKSAWYKEGIEKGTEKGTEKGIEKGKVAEARKAVERVLRKRNLATTEAQAAQLAACHDLDTLERWLDLAITAPSAADVFG